MRRPQTGGFVASGADVLALDPLTRRDAERLVWAMTDAAPLRPHDVEAVVARAAGNPLFLEEILLHRGADRQRRRPAGLARRRAQHPDRPAQPRGPPGAAVRLGARAELPGPNAAGAARRVRPVGPPRARRRARPLPRRPTASAGASAKASCATSPTRACRTVAAGSCTSGPVRLPSAERQGPSRAGGGHARPALLRSPGHGPGVALRPHRGRTGPWRPTPTWRRPPTTRRHSTPPVACRRGRRRDGSSCAAGWATPA